jgi:GNAT superfamily N-acetyltransferase
MGVQMMKLCPVRCDDLAFAEYVALFAQCFPGESKFNRDFLSWLYRDNPDGQVLGFDAREGERLAAHYACIPVRALIGDQEVKVLLSLNTATHPDYQGQGLFTQLAESTYGLAASLGYDCVYGVANANSTPGFIRKLGFQLVGPLRAMAGLGPLRMDTLDAKALQFRRVWSPQSLAWRCASPANPLTARKGADRTTFLAPALLGGLCMATAEIENSWCQMTPSTVSSGGWASPLRLFLGRVPKSVQRQSLYLDIPEKLKPSPLNLIYRSLSGRVQEIDQDAVFMTFLDFDAY